MSVCAKLSVCACAFFAAALVGPGVPPLRSNAPFAYQRQQQQQQQQQGEGGSPDPGQLQPREEGGPPLPAELLAAAAAFRLRVRGHGRMFAHSTCQFDLSATSLQPYISCTA